MPTEVLHYEERTTVLLAVHPFDDVLATVDEEVPGFATPLVVLVSSIVRSIRVTQSTD
jgi:hypothetical protein